SDGLYCLDKAKAIPATGPIFPICRGYRAAHVFSLYLFELVTADVGFHLVGFLGGYSLPHLASR
ncbi:hypothetical protein KAT59_06995, partial [Candidatus Bipolaricaulota bacterium]|nr:hypothetical protein [Candidatus Bipolaricaulota bacterium]